MKDQYTTPRSRTFYFDFIFYKYMTSPRSVNQPFLNSLFSKFVTYTDSSSL